ncbi:NAD-dependent epimerase/dehydratase family protein, partial [Acinetobacter baumannii]
YIRLDIADPEQVRKTLVEVRPDAVLHLAAISFVPDAERDFARAMRVNVAGTDSLCRTLIEERIDAKFLFVSSPEVYGIAPSEAMPLTEN